MASQIALLVVGFVLTTILGGALGTHFQRQTWKNQHDLQLSEQELERASHTCYSLSTLIDRRLYRMVRLEAAMARCGEAGFTRDDVEVRIRGMTRCSSSGTTRAERQSSGGRHLLRRIDASDTRV